MNTLRTRVSKKLVFLIYIDHCRMFRFVNNLPEQMAHRVTQALTLVRGHCWFTPAVRSY